MNRGGTPREPRPQYDSGAAGRLPEKVEHEHRWIAGVVYALGPGQMSAVAHGARVNLDHENRVSIEYGCWDCHQPYELVAQDPCPAPAQEV